MRKYRNQIKQWGNRSLVLFLTVALLICSVSIIRLWDDKNHLQQRLNGEVSQEIAEKIFRFHVIANSDRKKDQELKLKIKSAVIDYINQIVGENSNFEDTKEGILIHLSKIRKIAEGVVFREGYDYPVTARVGKSYFPDKTYGDCTFPAGKYEALILTIGSGKGKNWWCVLYPGLCFMNDTYGIVTEEKKEELREVLTEEEFLSLWENPEEKKKIRLGFKWL
ncbi:MAG: stage II sporulation protein R [Blautia sp.]